MTELQSDWCSPKRFQISPTTRYDFQGDRFIPSRSLMDLDQAHSLLTNRDKPRCNSSFGESYRRKLEEKLNLDSQGKPFRMLVFRGSPKSNRRLFSCIDEMRRDEAQELEDDAKSKAVRRMPKRESMVLDAPKIKNDFYLNIMDWGKNNVLAIALGSELYLWNSETRKVGSLKETVPPRNFPTSVAWSRDAKSLAVGYQGSNLQLWDAETLQLVRSFDDHTGRVATLAWNGYNLTSGSRDKSIINHDVRAGRNVTTRMARAHGYEVCGLKWSERGNVLASGGNDNLLYLWEISKMSSSSFLHRFDDHTAAVKALAWCPYHPELLASGGGTQDGTIKIWNTQKGVLVNSLNTGSQISGLEWNRHHKELLSGHGFTAGEPPNQMSLWRYPSLTKVGDLAGHSSRILQLSQSPDGLTVVSAGADESLRFWKIFGPPRPEESNVSELDGFLSLKTSPMR